MPTVTLVLGSTRQLVVIRTGRYPFASDQKLFPSIFPPLPPPTISSVLAFSLVAFFFPPSATGLLYNSSNLSGFFADQLDLHCLLLYTRQPALRVQPAACSTGRDPSSPAWTVARPRPIPPPLGTPATSYVVMIFKSCLGLAWLTYSSPWLGSQTV